MPKIRALLLAERMTRHFSTLPSMHK